MTDARPAAVAICFVLLGCAGPTVRDSAVTHQAELSAGSMVSELRTAYLVTGAQLEGDTWWRYTDVVVTDSEAAAATIESTFTSRQPPSPTSEKLYERTSKALSEAADLVTDLRIAVRKHDEATIREVRKKVAVAADDLALLEEQLG